MSEEINDTKPHTSSAVMIDRVINAFELSIRLHDDRHYSKTRRILVEIIPAMDWETIDRVTKILNGMN